MKVPTFRLCFVSRCLWYTKVKLLNLVGGCWVVICLNPRTILPETLSEFITEFLFVIPFGLAD